ncbi:hypothetical protein DACRYDRAFT_23358 [Dacryopinax primogenitus]|uniref:Uncharacterized protein n=1 Tax=Dacryopinax primogenitus (strain DJM 731) TaxID=1858805 RepID=M5G3P4_DACPD|nr:uncharacterized protein DACRYDRAFT_23358 [Dacryopinax primogenitus]EJU00477.1 hypothetical protein DACRYDRAFT_23358 [Dacryopinax primogenitus]
MRGRAKGIPRRRSEGEKKRTREKDSRAVDCKTHIFLLPGSYLSCCFQCTSKHYLSAGTMAFESLPTGNGLAVFAVRGSKREHHIAL